jgi:hypothetical protein
MTSRFRVFEQQELKTGRRQCRQIIVAVTANRAEDLTEEERIQFDHICSKPIEMQDIEMIINTHCFSSGSRSFDNV